MRQQLRNEMLATRRVPAPIVREHDQRCGFNHGQRPVLQTEATATLPPTSATTTGRPLAITFRMLVKRTWLNIAENELSVRFCNGISDSIKLVTRRMPNIACNRFGF